MNGELIALALVGIVVLVSISVGCVAYLYFFRLLFRTHVAQCSLSLWTIVRLFFRGSSPQVIVNSYIDLHKAGQRVSVEELEGFFKEGGHVREVARAMVAAKKNGNEVDFETARSIDLSGKDVMEEIGAGAELDSVTD